MKKIELKSSVISSLSPIVSNWSVDNKNQITGILNNFAHSSSILEISKDLYEIIELSGFSIERGVNELTKLLTSQATTIRNLILFYQNYSKLIPSLQSDMEQFLKLDKNIEFTIELLNCGDSKVIRNAINEVKKNPSFNINRENGRRIKKIKNFKF